MSKISPLDPQNAHKLFGIIPLFQIARIFNVPYEELARERKRLGASPSEGRTYPITSDTISALGVKPDVIVASEHKIPLMLVTKLREQLGITPSSNTHEENPAKEIERSHKPKKEGRKHAIPPEAINALAVKPDAVVACEYNIPQAFVARLRKQLGIPPSTMSRRELQRELMNAKIRKNWHDKDPLLGTDTDKRVARRLGLPFKTIRNRREELGIPEFTILNIPSHSWTEAEDKLLGTTPDSDLADDLGITKQSVRRHRQYLGIPNYKPITPPRSWSEAENKLLGTMPDRDLADELGLAMLSVRRQRQSLGIPNFKITKMPRSYDRPKWHSLVGTMADTKLAEETGLSSTRIAQVRCRYRIPAYKNVYRLSDPKELVLALLNVPRSKNLADRLLVNCTRLIELISSRTTDD